MVALPYARWRGDFATALDHRFYTLEHLDGLIATGRAHCLAADDAAILFEFRIFPTGTKAVSGLVAAGNIDTIISRLIPAAEQIGRSEGCAFALIESRVGWGRALKKQGYAPYQTAIAKAL